jgi:hypothetical protein
LLALISLTAIAAVTGEEYHPNRLIVKYKQPLSKGSMNKTAAAVGAGQMSSLCRQSLKRQALSPFKSTYVLVFADSTARKTAEALLASDPNVEHVERDYRYELFYDPLFEDQWALSNHGQPYYGVIRVAGENNDTLTRKVGTSGADIKWVEAKTASTGRHRVLVGVTDTGVDYRHPDLRDHIWRNEGEIPDNGIDDDFNGLVDDYYGYDFSGDDQNVYDFPGDSDPMDTIGHGTHVSGIIGAVGGNGIGIEGIADDVSIMCIKVFPNAFASVLAPAIVYAVDNGAEVINASWGSPFYSSTTAEAVKYAADQGVLFVAASGNSGNSTPYYPAVLDYAFTVGASNSHDRVTAFSTYGYWLDVAAPGEDILSLRASGTDMYAASGEPNTRIVDSIYSLADGTSMAAPHVVGAAAFILSVSPGLSLDSLRHLLTASADPIADPAGRPLNGFNSYSGNGRLNLGRAVSFLSDEFAELEEPSFNSLQHDTVSFVGSAYSGSGRTYQLEVKPASLGEWIEVGAGAANLIRDTLVRWDSSPYDGKTEVRVRVGDDVIYNSTVRLANSRQVEIISPRDGDSVRSFVEIVGSGSAPGFKSYELAYYADSDPTEKHLIKFANEILFRAKLADWTVGALLPGSGTIKLTVTVEQGFGDTAVTVLEASRRVIITSLMTAGYPIGGATHPHLTSAVGNIDDDPGLEVITAGTDSLMIDHCDQGRLEYLRPRFGTLFRSSLALYDFDSDGKDEIVCVSDSGVDVFNAAGESRPGWPKRITTGWQFDGFPSPLVTDLDNDGIMEILVVNQGGLIYCWRADGRSYFPTMGGLFTRIDRTGKERIFGGATVAFLFAYDYNHDGYRDVGTLYTSVGNEGGLYMYSGKNAQPLFREIGAKTISTQAIFGGVAADFDGDGAPEIAFAHWIGGRILQMGVSIVRADGSALPGWPKYFYDKVQWLSPFPAAADVDRDSLPELIMVFSALDGGEVFVWNGDGTPLLQSAFGRSDGFLAGTSNSLGNPIVIDIDNDGQYEIAARGGATLLGKPERVYSWELDGTLTKGWPMYTYADPGEVIYSPFNPVAGDLNDDGLLELYMGSSDSRLYSWSLPTVASDSAILWGNFLYDNQHTGILPFLERELTPPPPPPPPPIPSAFRLGQNYPNPFNENTAIEVDIPTDGAMKLEIINILGQSIATLCDGEVKAGYLRFAWDGYDRQGHAIASGVYFYRMRIGTLTQVKKMVLLK